MILTSKPTRFCTERVRSGCLKGQLTIAGRLRFWEGKALCERQQAEHREIDGRCGYPGRLLSIGWSTNEISASWRVVEAPFDSCRGCCADRGPSLYATKVGEPWRVEVVSQHQTSSLPYPSPPHPTPRLLQRPKDRLRRSRDLLLGRCRRPFLSPRSKSRSFFALQHISVSLGQARTN